MLMASAETWIHVCLGGLSFLYLYRFWPSAKIKKCSICSFQFSLWDDFHWKSSRLTQFLNLGSKFVACSTSPAGRPSIALHLGTAHILQMMFYIFWLHMHIPKCATYFCSQSNIALHRNRANPTSFLTLRIFSINRVSADARPRNQKFCARATPIWRSRKGQRIRRAMNTSRLGITALLIAVNPAPGKYENASHAIITENRRQSGSVASLT